MNTKTDKVRLQLDIAHAEYPVHSIWRHYKGGVYQVVDHAYSCEEDEPTIIYKRIDGPNFDSITEQFIKYARPLSVMSTENRFTRVHKTTVTVWAEGKEPTFYG